LYIYDNKKQTELGRLEAGMTAVMHEMIALKCAGHITNGITASHNPCSVRTMLHRISQQWAKIGFCTTIAICYEQNFFLILKCC